MRKEAKPLVVGAARLSKGQLWRYGAQCISIQRVGKVNVEHRDINLAFKRSMPRTKMSRTEELQQFLIAHHAMLVTVD